jgi:hypothetical protein
MNLNDLPEGAYIFISVIIFMICMTVGNIYESNEKTYYIKNCLEKNMQFINGDCIYGPKSFEKSP